MRFLHLAITAGVLAAGATAITAQDRAAAKVSPGQAAIDRAAAANKYVFIFFWKEKNSQTDKAWSVLQPAAAKLADSADVVSIRITDPAEKQVVDKYGVTRAPMPLVLAVAPCGAITKAFTTAFDENQLRTAFVSPCTQLCLKALQSRKLVFVCVVEKTDPQNPPPIPQGVQDFKADKKYASCTEVILLDAGDAAEAALLKDFEVGPNATKPLTIFLAPPGTLIGRFGGEASKEALAAKLAAAQSGCCPGGKCGPGGCGPKK